MSEKSKKISERLLWIYFVVLCLVLLVLLGVKIVQDYGPGLQGNPVGRFESGYYSERYLCSESGACVLFRSPMPMMNVSGLEINGERYLELKKGDAAVWTMARGIYCPGRMSTHSCFEVVALYPLTTCPTAITYLGLRVPLVPNSCVLGNDL